MDEVFGACACGCDVFEVLNLCSRAADAVTTAVCGDSSVEIFCVFFGGVFVGFNGYIEVGLSTTEGVDAVET